MKQSVTTDQIAPQTTETLPVEELNRVEVNGWNVIPSDGNTSVPNPVYCRPIFNSEEKTQV